MSSPSIIGSVAANSSSAAPTASAGQKLDLSTEEYVLFATPTPEPPPVAPPSVRPMIVLCDMYWEHFGHVAVHDHCRGGLHRFDYSGLVAWCDNMRDRFQSEACNPDLDFMSDLMDLHGCYHVTRHCQPATAHLTEWIRLGGRIHGLMRFCVLAKAGQSEQIPSLVRDSASD